MGEKKRKEAQVKTWYKIIVVLACVFVAGLMIVSSLGTGWITALRAIQPGDSVTVQVTINDASGDPLVTSDPELYQKRMEANEGLFYANNIVFLANRSATDALVPVPVYSTSNGWSDTFALFSTEYNAISQGLIGMKTNEEKTLSFPSADAMIETWSTAQLASQGVNLTDVHVGDQLSIAVSSDETLEQNATKSSYSIRIGEVTAKTATGISINFGYPTINIKVLDVSNN